jgi:hypothetical protein
VTAPGHKGYTATDVKIDIGKDYSLPVSLEVGEISENVTVVAGADLINSTSGELSNTVSQRQIVELPLNGRNPLTLVLLQPGTSSNSAQNTVINGQRSSFTNITRDGINVQDNFIRANAVDFIPDRPNVDDTGEFTIVTQNAGAESGYGSSQIQLVTPRGSNEFHGAAYIYNRNSKFAANTFFNNTNRIGRPFLNRNQFGGKVGGPILKNRLFFFGAYEGFRLRQAATANRTILLPDARNGLFTYQDTRGNVRTVNLLAAPFSTITGVTAINPIIQSRILAGLPTAGNNPALGDRFNTTGFSVPRQQNQDREAFSTRFDYDISGSQSISGIYSYRKEYLFRTDVDAQQGGTACCYTTVPPGFQDAHTKFLNLAWRWSPTANITNEVRGGWQGSDPRFGANTAEPAYFIQVPLINNPETGFQAQGRKTDIYNIQDNAVWARGSHSFRLGGQMYAFRIAPFGPGAFGASYIPNVVIGGGGTPAYTGGLTGSFNTAAGCVTSGANAGLNCASDAFIGTATNLARLLGGLVGSVTQTFNADSQQGTLQPVPPSRQLFYEHYSFYLSDQWRATPRLTLNLGLRYELFSPVREPNGLALEPVQDGRDIVTTILDPNGTYNFVGTNNGGTNFFKWDKNNIAPVFSFAYSPSFKNNFLNNLMPGEGRTVIRGGYRMSYVNDEFVRAADNALIGNQGLSSGVTLGALNSVLGSHPTPSAPALQVPRTYAQNNVLAGNFGTVFAIDPDLEVPRTHEFNIGIEREIGFQTAFEIRYVHGRSDNLVRGLDFNQIRIFDNGYLADFQRAQSNLALTQAERARRAALGLPLGPVPLSIGPNALVPGTVPLTVISTLAAGGLPTNSTIIGLVAGATPGDLAFTYVANNIGGSSALFLNNPNTGVADLLNNSAKYRYNALQTEIRRRFSQGLTFQANYTFQKTLTDAPGTGQTRFEPLIDNALGRDLEYAIADYDTTHVFNLNAIYELPFGRGKRWGTDAGSWMERLIGGWQVTSIIRWDSAAPFTIADPRGTLNRGGRSGRQTAFSTLTTDQIKDLVGVFRTNCGVYFINPQVINLDLIQCEQGLVRPRLTGTTAGVASFGFAQAPVPGSGFQHGQVTFPGQVFYHVGPGQTGNMARNAWHGPIYFNWDASIIKNIRISENVRFQIRGEAFNVLNRANFVIPGQFANVASTTFGRMTGTFTPRIVQFVGRIEF